MALSNEAALIAGRKPCAWVQVQAPTADGTCWLVIGGKDNLRGKLPRLPYSSQIHRFFRTGHNPSGSNSVSSRFYTPSSLLRPAFLAAQPANIEPLSPRAGTGARKCARAHWAKSRKPLSPRADTGVRERARVHFGADRVGWAIIVTNPSACGLQAERFRYYSIPDEAPSRPSLEPATLL